MHGLYGSMEAEFEVQRTIKRAELTAFFCLLKKVIEPIERLWKGERKCIDPKVGDADLWIKIWEELHMQISKEIWVKVEYVKAHRTRTDKQ